MRPPSPGGPGGPPGPGAPPAPWPGPPGFMGGFFSGLCNTISSWYVTILSFFFYHLLFCFPAFLQVGGKV
jgi:hypothetical protein